MAQIERALPEQRLLQYDPGAWFLGTCLKFNTPPTTLERLEAALFAYERLPVEQQLLCDGMGRLCRAVLALPDQEDSTKPKLSPKPSHKPFKSKRRWRRRVKKVNPEAVRKYLRPRLKSMGLDRDLFCQYNE